MPEQNGAAAPIRGPHIEPDVTARRRWETANPGAPWTPGANQLRSERDLKTVDGQTYRIYFGTKACRRLEEIGAVIRSDRRPPHAHGRKNVNLRGGERLYPKWTYE